MTYAAAVDFLYGIRLHGQKLGLDTMRELVRRLGDPHRNLRFIHIAGTNGKGSVAAMLAAVLGDRAGLYTSPHLVSFCERFQIGGRPIAESEVVRLVEHLRPLLADFPERAPTFFEVVTAMALVYFREQRADPVVWETGLGGRLDATNIVTPLVAVITPISFDHQQYLGTTLAEIAGEKAGIIKPGVPVVTAPQPPAALAVIRQACAARGCRLIEVREPLDWEVPLVGAHQRWNCATAVAALRLLGWADTAIRAGLKKTSWPGRFQVLPGPVVLDGAHNPAGAEALAATLRAQYPGRKIALILGVLRDKDYRAVCRILAPVADQIYCVPVRSERTSAPEALAAVCGGTVCRGLPEAYARARAAAEVVVVSGSLFLVGEALQFFGVSQPVAPREPGLQ
jgi:dihydrofolate synthase/folylpolyglutamate synthase